MKFRLKGKLFDDIGDDFWAYGPGAMSWTIVMYKDRELTALYALMPNDSDKFQGKSVLHLLYMDSEPNNWARPGPIRHWDGNREHPTLSPSIGADHWHGYIKNGDLYDA